VLFLGKASGLYYKYIITFVNDDSSVVNKRCDNNIRLARKKNLTGANDVAYFCLAVNDEELKKFFFH